MSRKGNAIWTKLKSFYFSINYRHLWLILKILKKPFQLKGFESYSRSDVGESKNKLYKFQFFLQRIFEDWRHSFSILIFSFSGIVTTLETWFFSKMRPHFFFHAYIVRSDPDQNPELVRLTEVNLPCGHRALQVSDLATSLCGELSKKRIT